MKLWTVASALIAAALSVVPAAAATIPFSAILSPANEVPPTASTGSGTAILDLDVVAHTLRVQIAFSGLVPTAPAGSPVGTTASHIHCCLPSPFATGVNAGVATTTPTFAGFPLGVLAGTYDNTLDLTLGVLLQSRLRHLTLGRWFCRHCRSDADQRVVEWLDISQRSHERVSGWRDPGLRRPGSRTRNVRAAARRAGDDRHCNAQTPAGVGSPARLAREFYAVAD